jgi:hypothetical protein
MTGTVIPVKTALRSQAKLSGFAGSGCFCVFEHLEISHLENEVIMPKTRFITKVQFESVLLTKIEIERYCRIIFKEGGDA